MDPYSSRASQSVGSSVQIPSQPSLLPPGPKSPKSQVFYAVVLHDFEAERADELDARRGDTITVVAQSNREWFVAKPIGRLGRPGLIPVSFVEIHDSSTGKPIADVNALMDRGDLPKVEDWKRAMFNYKQNSIALGVLDTPSSRDSTNPYGSIQQSPPKPPPQQSPPQQSMYAPSQAAPMQEPIIDPLPEGILLSADVVSFHYEMEEHWFRINALFQPYAPAGERDLPPAKQLILFRVYNDFYDFQVSLLDTFPREAGREPPHNRILPFMPGPSQNVDDALTSTRRSELDDYLHNLCGLNSTGAPYILEHRVVRDFLSLKAGDVETETEPRVRELEALFNPDYQEADDGYASQASRNDSPYGELPQSLGRLNMQDDHDDGSEYEDEGYAPSPQRSAQDRHPYSQRNGRPSDGSNLRLHAHTQSHQRSGSTTSFNQNYSSNSRSNSPAPRSGSPQANSGDYSQPRWNGNGHNGHTQSTSSMRSSQPSTRSRSGSVATNNFNSPSISAANPQTAFVKIKIFDRVADDLIAIRVHPRVSHVELMDKVQARLGGEVVNLRFRDSLSNAFIGLDNDEDLRAWMEGTDKHVLYAD